MKKPYRSRDFNDERKWKSYHLIDDVKQVGLQKAVGYIIKSLTFSFTENTIKEDFVLLEKEFKEQGKLTKIIRDKIPLEILWVGDPAMMKTILDNNEEIIVKSGWSVNPKEFFSKLCKTDIDHNKNRPMYHIIAELFNSWCLWCEKPIWFDGNALSENPYDPDLDYGQSIIH